MTITLLITFISIIIFLIWLKSQKKLFLKDKNVIEKYKLQFLDINKTEELLLEEYFETKSINDITSHNKKNNPHEYNIDMANYTCTCKDWIKTRSKYSKYDPRRLCKHIINNFEYKKGREGWMNDDCLIIPKEFIPFGYSIFKNYKNREGFFLYKEIYFHKKFVIMKSNGKYIDYAMDINHSPACGYWDLNTFRKNDGNFYGRGWSIYGCRMYLACYIISKIYNLSLDKFNILDFSKAQKIENNNLTLLDFKQAVKLSMKKENISLSLYMELFIDLNLISEDNNGYYHLKNGIEEFAIIKKRNKKKLHFYTERFHNFCLFIKEKLESQNYFSFHSTSPETVQKPTPILNIFTNKSSN